MNFTAVPAGTAAPAALVLRGADHDLEFPSASPLNMILGDALHATNAAVANTKAIPYSDLAGLITSFLFTSDAVVLATVLWQLWLPCPFYPARIDRVEGPHGGLSTKLAVGKLALPTAKLVHRCRAHVGLLFET